jgi:hypothetical protein
MHIAGRGIPKQLARDHIAVGLDGAFRFPGAAGFHFQALGRCKDLRPFPLLDLPDHLCHLEEGSGDEAPIFLFHGLQGSDRLHGLVRRYGQRIHETLGVVDIKQMIEADTGDAHVPAQAGDFRNVAVIQAHDRGRNQYGFIQAAQKRYGLCGLFEHPGATDLFDHRGVGTVQADGERGPIRRQFPGHRLVDERPVGVDGDIDGIAGYLVDNLQDVGTHERLTAENGGGKDLEPGHLLDQAF